jgi:hypothetical protein
MRLLTGAAAVAVALVSAAASSAAVITQTTTTASYKLTLEVGPTETMYTAAQVKSMHPTSGEVMLGNGSMMSGGMSGMSGSTRHLEVHIFSRSTGKVLTGLMPSIVVTDTSDKAMMADRLSVVTMEGIGEGVADYHYGNNVTLTRGHLYRVMVTVKGQKATFSFKAS